MIKHKSLRRIFLLLFLLAVPQTVSATINPFPIYPNIQANIKFWEKVYSQYSSKHGLIHDSNNLAVIYEVIDLQDRKIPGNYRINRRKIKLAKKKYRQILNNLASGRPASSPTEKKIIAMFGGHPSAKVLRRAAQNVRFQLCLKNRFRQGVIRSGRYLAKIKQIFRNNHLPTDLAYLPHVESSYNYEAYSKFGAAGIWQFIRSTGRRFLTISYTVDERRDPIVASRAAAKFLKENYQKLGDWPLAITAYNHGANSMLRAQKKFGAYDKIIDNYQNRRFGFASKNFYPEFLAARKIAKHYQKYFPDLQPERPVATENFQLEGYAGIHEVAKFFNLGTKQIKSLNPALRRPIFSGQKYIPKHYTLRLPKGALNKQAEIPAYLYKKSQKRSRFYRVSRGDTAGKIARMQRVKLADLLDFNQLGRRAVIYVGQNLRIPAPGEHRLASLEASSVSKGTRARLNSRKAAISKAIRKKEQPEPPKQISVKKPITKLAVVKPPESTPQPIKLASILNSMPKGFTMRQSHTTNWQVNANDFLAGHKTELEKEQPAANPPPDNLISVNPEVLIGNFQVGRIYTDKRGKRIGVIQVQESETLGHYADWLNIPTQKIRDLNHLSFRRQIKNHQKIKIPLNKIGKEAFEERRYEFHKGIAEDFFAAFKVSGVQTYTVKRGDNIWTITHNELDLPFWLMKRYNPNVAFENLHPKQKLLFPVVEKI